MTTNKMHVIRHYVILMLCIAAGIALDQGTKYLAVVKLKNTNCGTVVLWDKILQFTYLENKGAAWGIGQGKSLVFFILGIIIILILARLYIKIPFQKHFIPMRICAVLFVCGAIGNMIDRIRLGYVIDFFEFGFINFPIFNVADIYVTCAAAMSIIFGFFFYKEQDFAVFTARNGEE